VYTINYTTQISGFKVFHKSVAGCVGPKKDEVTRAHRKVGLYNEIPKFVVFSFIYLCVVYFTTLSQ
jgi:hypothetical protein